MALAKSSTAMTVIFFMMMITLCGIAMSAEHKVDLDSDGWTIMDDDDYEVQVNLGDSVVFEYDNTSHNVIEVALEDYNSCNAASPISKYTSGNATVTFDKLGNFYFICGFPDHCQNGEKVIIKVENTEPPVMAPEISNSGNSPSTTSSGRKIISPRNKSK